MVFFNALATVCMRVHACGRPTGRYIAPTPFYTTVIFAFRERGLLSLEDPVGTVSMFFHQLREVHGIESQQLHVHGQFGDDEEGYRLFVLWRSKPLAPEEPSPEQ